MLIRARAPADYGPRAWHHRAPDPPLRKATLGSRIATSGRSTPSNRSSRFDCSGKRPARRLRRCDTRSESTSPIGEGRQSPPPTSVGDADGPSWPAHWSMPLIVPHEFRPWPRRSGFFPMMKGNRCLFFRHDSYGSLPVASQAQRTEHPCAPSLVIVAIHVT